MNGHQSWGLCVGFVCDRERLGSPSADHLPLKLVAFSTVVENMLMHVLLKWDHRGPESGKTCR